MSPRRGKASRASSARTPSSPARCSRLPAGELLTAFGGEYRYEELQDQFDRFATSGGVIDLNSTSASGDRDIIAGFAEFYAADRFEPDGNFRDQQAGSADRGARGKLQRLRFDRKSEIRARLAPHPRLAPAPRLLQHRLPRSFSRAIIHRFTHLFAGAAGHPRFVVTGAPEDESQSIQILSGGNPNLDAEDSENISAGIVLTPPVVPGLTLSADYFHIKMENSIASLDPQFILDNEADFPASWCGPRLRRAIMLSGFPATFSW